MNVDAVVLDDGKLNMAMLEIAIAESSLAIDGVCATGANLLRRMGVSGWPRAHAWLDRRGMLHIKLYIAASMGQEIPVLTKRVQDEITSLAERVTKRKVAPVDVYVRRVVG